MFDTRSVGKKIMTLRKGLNLTQMNLADVMEVSYQAVSNWERGNSMPDISKLPELAECLKTNIDYLLGASEETETLKGLVNKPCKEGSIKGVKELKAIAPIIQPQAVDSLIEGLELKMNDLAQFAPFATNNYLDGLVDQINLDEDFSDFMQLAPFLSNERLRTLADDLLKTQAMDKLKSLAPFLEGQYIDQLIINQYRGLDIGAFYPFMSENTADQLADLMMADKSYEGVQGLLPFLSQDKVDDFLVMHGDKPVNFLPFVSSAIIDDLVENLFEQGDIKASTPYLPFMSSCKLDQLVIDYFGGKDASIQSFYPFLSQETLNTLADQMFKRNGIKGLANIAPFL